MRHSLIPAAALLATLALAPAAMATDPVNVVYTPRPKVNANGLLEHKTITATGTTIRRTDGMGRVREAVDAQGRTTVMHYDNAGNMVSSRDANGVGVDCLYDELNRKVMQTDTSGAVTEFEYNAAGQITRVKDGKNQWTTQKNRYDAAGQLIEQYSTLTGYKVTYAYDANGNRTSITDSEGGATKIYYDSTNIEVARELPGHNAASSFGQTDWERSEVTVDALGRPIARKNSAGEQLQFTYDFAGRMVTRTHVNASGTTESTDTFTYDVNNRVLSATCGRYNNTVAHTYDNAGRLATESLTVGSTTYTTSYQYDTIGRLISITYPDATVITREYDASSRLTAIKQGTSTIASFTYDSAGRETSRTLGNGQVISRTYRNDGLLSTLTSAGDTTTYSYDANKNLTGEAISGTLANYSTSMGQDAANRLTTFSRTNGDAQSWNLSLEGDWASQTTNSTTETRTHNAKHEILTSSQGNPTHDSKGNVLTDGQGNTYTWDLQNQLKQVTNGSSTINYAYDAMGRRISQTISGTTTVFVQAGSQVIAEYQGGTLQNKNVWGSYVDELIAVQQSSGTLYAHQDRRYNVVAITDASGTVQQRFAYDPYGKRIVLDGSGNTTTAAALTRYGYTGREHDAVVSTLVYFRSRYFSTKLGRFLTHDVEYLDGWNLYGGYFGMWGGVDPAGYGNLLHGPRGSCPAEDGHYRPCASPPSAAQDCCTDEFKKRIVDALAKFNTCPTAKKMMEDVTKKLGGPIQVECVTSDGPSRAMWVAATRTIQINCKFGVSLDAIVSDILWELQNANAQDKAARIYADAAKGLMGRDAYAKAIELVEYGNLANHHKMAADCIKSSGWAACSDDFADSLLAWTTFEKYLATQEEGGHTAVYRKQWDAAYKTIFCQKNPTSADCK